MPGAPARGSNGWRPGSRPVSSGTRRRESPSFRRPLRVLGKGSHVRSDRQPSTRGRCGCECSGASAAPRGPSAREACSRPQSPWRGVIDSSVLMDSPTWRFGLRSPVVWPLRLCDILVPIRSGSGIRRDRLAYPRISSGPWRDASRSSIRARLRVPEPGAFCSWWKRRRARLPIAGAFPPGRSSGPTGIWLWESRICGICRDRSDWHLPAMLAAYNAGAAKTEEWVGLFGDPDLFIERIGWRETRDYVRHVLDGYWTYRSSYPPGADEGSGP